MEDAVLNSFMFGVACWQLIGRRLVSTAKGYVGAPLGHVRAKDLVCVVAGSQVPLVLRRADGDMFELVGEGYFHGLMDGEAFEGLGDIESRLQAFDIR